MIPINVLIVGSGGREHALAWKCAQSLWVDRLFVSPGNAGTAECATNLPIPADKFDALVNAVHEKEIGLVIIGPEQPLAAGLTDRLTEQGIKVFGPTRAAARLESSKAFAKAFMRSHNIPTANFETFTEYDAAVEYIESLPEAGVVVKASGLAAGKGVIVCDNRRQALDAVKLIMQQRKFGAAGSEVVIEERLTGPELSLLAFCDGRHVVPMVTARDHKPVYDGDQGPNTGGMGVVAPAPGVEKALVDEIVQTVLRPTLDGLADAGTSYVGVLYAGLMLTPDGPRVLEFNCRFGDPETQVILPLLDSDLVEIALACVAGELEEAMVRFQPKACAAVVMTSGGYPGNYERGFPITGIDQANGQRHTHVFHAGTAQEHGTVVTAGGRVLAISAIGDDLDEALQCAYKGVELIQFKGAYFRTDIGRFRPINKEQSDEE